MHINNLLCSQKHGRIPGFLADYWKKTHGVDPVLFLQESAKWENRFWRSLIPGVVIAFIGIALLVIQVNFRDWKGLTLFGVGIVVTVVTFFKGVMNSYEKESVARPYYNAVNELFTQFRITPSEELGTMSREEFTGYIVSLLEKGGANVDRAVGFEKVRMRDEFKQAHAAALAFGLCNREWTAYFPKKKEVGTKS